MAARKDEHHIVPVFQRHPGVIRRFTEADTTTGVLLSNFQNLGRQHSEGLELALMLPLGKTGRLNWTASAYRVVNDGSRLESPFSSSGPAGPVDSLPRGHSGPIGSSRPTASYAVRRSPRRDVSTALPPSTWRRAATFLETVGRSQFKPKTSSTPVAGRTPPPPKTSPRNYGASGKAATST